MDEPHSYDHFIPYREVESVQKTLDPPMRDKLMLTKIYPEWSGYKEGLNVIDTWTDVVKPRKLMFWFYTIFNYPKGTYLSQLQLRPRLKEAAKYDKDFFFTAQTFGTRDTNYIGVIPPHDDHYFKYRTPTGSQVLGQSMLALAYGCKGILYETYYSDKSNSTDWGNYFAESLVGDNPDILHFDKPRTVDYGLYDTIASLGRRLKGPLGNLLPKLEFSGEEAYIFNKWEGGRYPAAINTTKLRIYGPGIPEYPSTRWVNLGVTRLHPKVEYNLTSDYYFLLNQNTSENIRPESGDLFSYYNNIHVGITVAGPNNWCFLDVEGGYSFAFENASSTGIDFSAVIPIGRGDGRLFRLIPTLASTGPLVVDETIQSGETFSSEGTITVPSGVTLKIEGNYTLKDSLIIEDGGVLTLEPGSTLNLDSASSVYCAGDIYVDGIETDRVTINFLQPDETKQNSIYLGKGSSAILNFADIKNGYSGITATSGFDTLMINQCKFTNFSNAGIVLNGTGFENALITNNNYSNCEYAGFITNISTVVINSDSANTRSGYCFTGVSDLWFGGNTLTGTQEGIGLSLTGCYGNIYNNRITNHTDGILLADSYPKIGGNEITNNTQRGLVCEYGSSPDLEEFRESGVCEQLNTYPLSGFNTIFNNGDQGIEELDAEIFLDKTTIHMAGETNAVFDNDSLAFIAGICTDDPFDLSGNYWGTTGVDETRFELADDNTIIYTPQLSTFNPVISPDCPFVINLSAISFTDTLYRMSNVVPGTGGGREERYMATGQYDSAYSEFKSMSLISGTTTTIDTRPLRGMYRSGKLATNKETKLYQLTLKTDSLLNSIADTNLVKTLNRLKVFIEADNNNIQSAQVLASNNTASANTETEQFHAQTEELAIALRGAALNRNMKKDVGSITTMNKTGLQNLMKRHSNKFTIKKEPKPVDVITEYSLSQNYPNPFNSSTIIEYALPKDGLVSIKLFDITGRLVKQLVNEQKPMGRHRTTIDSRNLASGVYIYSLRVNDININKKLVILK